MLHHLQGTLAYLNYHHLSDFEELKHYVSTRHGGVSKGTFSSLNISLGTADEQSAILENRHRIAQMMGVSDKRLIFPRQTHQDQIRCITATSLAQEANALESYLQCTDALITQEKGCCISVISADCVPVLFFDPVQQAIGAAHGGWRGTVQKIAQKTALMMQTTFGTKPEDLRVGIGPSIGPKVYEVGTEVIEAVEKAFGTKKGLIHQETKAGKGIFDLWEANRRQLLDIGVKEANIECAEICTYTHHELFFSARRLNGKGGRFASGIMLTH